MEEIKKELERMANNLVADVDALREAKSEQLVGTEIMAVNALCNVIKTLKETG